MMKTTYFFTLAALACSLQLKSQSAVGAYPLLGNANDVSGNNYHGTLKARTNAGPGNNLPVSTPGHDGSPGSAYTFTTPSSDCGYIDFGQPALMNFDSTSFSVSLWFKYSGTPYAPTLITNVNSSYSSGFLLGLSNISGNIRPRFYIGPKPNTFQAADILADTVLMANHWYHFTAVADRTTKRMKCYIGGVQRKIVKNPGAPYGTIVGNNELDITGLQLSAAHSGSLYAGLSHNFLATHFTNGSLDNIHIFNRVLSPAEIAGLANDVVPTALNSYSLLESLTFYPNPAQAEIYIQAGAAAELQLSDLHGRILLEQRLDENGTKVEIGHLPGGLYIATISNGSTCRRIKFLKE